jgi:hypothetical protein
LRVSPAHGPGQSQRQAQADSDLAWRQQSRAETGPGFQVDYQLAQCIIDLISSNRASQNRKELVLVRDVATQAGSASAAVLKFWESTFADQDNPNRQTAGPLWGSPRLDLQPVPQ